MTLERLEESKSIYMKWSGMTGSDLDADEWDIFDLIVDAIRGRRMGIACRMAEEQAWTDAAAGGDVPYEYHALRCVERLAASIRGDEKPVLTPQAMTREELISEVELLRVVSSASGRPRNPCAS